MNDRRLVLLLLLSILFAGALLLFVLDRIGIFQAAQYFTFLQPDNPEKIEDMEYPSEVEKITLQKLAEKLAEKEEQLTQKELKLQEMVDNIQNQESEIEAIKKNIDVERSSIKLLVQDLNNRDKKVRDLAGKVLNMPPEKAVEMMVNWRDFDIIDVFRKMDVIAEEEGQPQITPYLLTLFSPERRAEISRKMLLPPVEQE
jgi:flagellar protein FlbB